MKQGPGQGSGATWLLINEVPSQGLSHRIYSFKTNRGIKHPNVRGINQVMTSDFLVDSSSHKQFAIQVKPLSELKDPRTIEKLEIERQYWQSKNIPWFIMTEKRN
jgi:hypothetical protein